MCLLFKNTVSLSTYGVCMHLWCHETTSLILTFCGVMNCPQVINQETKQAYRCHSEKKRRFAHLAGATQNEMTQKKSPNFWFVFPFHLFHLFLAVLLYHFSSIFFPACYFLGKKIITASASGIKATCHGNAIRNRETITGPHASGKDNSPCIYVYSEMSKGNLVDDMQFE